MIPDNLKDYLRSYESYKHTGGPRGIEWEYIYSPEISAYYGDIKSDLKGKFIEVPFCTYSDYSGSTVERSNCRTFLRTFEEFSEVSLWEIYGGYGTTGILITVELYESNEEIQETIQALFNYPLIDEEDMSELENEIENEDWNFWIKSELMDELEKQGIEYDEETLWDAFNQNCAAQNVYPTFEDAVSCWYDLEDIVKDWQS